MALKSSSPVLTRLLSSYSVVAVRIFSYSPYDGDVCYVDNFLMVILSRVIANAGRL